MDGTVCRKCDKCKFDFEYRIKGTKNPRFSQACIMCLDKKTADRKRRERGDIKEQWYWNGHLIIRRSKGNEEHSIIIKAYNNDYIFPPRRPFGDL